MKMITEMITEASWLTSNQTDPPPLHAVGFQGSVRGRVQTRSLFTCLH